MVRKAPGFTAIAVLSGISTFTESFFTVRIANWVLYDLRRRLYWHIQRLSLSYHDERRVGDLSSTLIGDIQVVQDMIANGVLDLVVSVALLVSVLESLPRTFAVPRS